MKKKTHLPLIFFSLIIALSLPVAFTEKLRSHVAAFFSGLFIEPQKKLSSDEITKRQFERLKNQNRILKVKLAQVIDKLKTSELFKDHKEALGKMSLQSRRTELLRLLELEHDGIHGNIVYRPVTSWNSGFWVDIGEEVNERLGYTVVGKNSPVLSEGYLIGIVEQVTRKQARIRLITDPDLFVAVRAKRNESLLAKGEIHGSDTSFSCRGATILRGQGFNYDFADGEGNAIDLRSHDPFIIKSNDILITTGLDGIFPTGIPVARVKEITPLKEGDYVYAITAEPLTPFDVLQTVFILPPSEPIAPN